MHIIKRSWTWYRCYTRNLITFNGIPTRNPGPRNPEPKISLFYVVQTGSLECATWPFCDVPPNDTMLNPFMCDHTANTNCIPCCNSEHIVCATRHLTHHMNEIQAKLTTRRFEGSYLDWKHDITQFVHVKLPNAVICGHTVAWHTQKQSFGWCVVAF